MTHPAMVTVCDCQAVVWMEAVPPVVPPDDYTCPTCGSRMRLYNAYEGTDVKPFPQHCFIPDPKYGPR